VDQGAQQKPTASDRLQRGRDAIRRYAWREAFELLAEVDEEEGLPPEDLEALGEAGWWTAHLDSTISARERAHTAYLDAGNKRRAAMMAIALTRDYFAKGSASIAKGWLGRAERLLAEEPDCLEKGHLTRTRAVIALEGEKDYPASLKESDRAYEVAERFADRDLLALSDWLRAAQVTHVAMEATGGYELLAVAGALPDDCVDLVDEERRRYGGGDFSKPCREPSQDENVRHER
jgi:hypothetical protein